MNKAENIWKKFVLNEFEKISSQNLEQIAKNHLEASKQYISEFEKLTIKINTIENDSKEKSNKIDEIVQ
jgi:peptidyl-tRNA hydrolase